MTQWTAEFDGGIRGGNPGGIPTYGVTFYDAYRTLHEVYGTVTGDLPPTNNVAEWSAMKVLLAHAWLWRECWDKLVIKGDSQLVIRQLSGEYQVNSEHLKPIYTKCRGIYGALMDQQEIELVWNRRAHNMRADKLAGQAYTLHGENVV